MNHKTSQVNRLLAHFNGGGTVTSFEAYERYSLVGHVDLVGVV